MNWSNPESWRLSSLIFKPTAKVDLSLKRKFIQTNICLLIYSFVLRAKARARNYTRFWRYSGKWDSPCTQGPHCVRGEKNVEQVTGHLLTSKSKCRSHGQNWYSAVFHGLPSWPASTLTGGGPSPNCYGLLNIFDIAPVYIAFMGILLLEKPTCNELICWFMMSNIRGTGRIDGPLM